MTKIKSFLFLLLLPLALIACGNRTVFTSDQLPYTGTLTLDEYDWFGITTFLGVIDIDLPGGEKKRAFHGKQPRRYPSGNTTFLQGCGDRVSRVVLADSAGLITPITPCSGEIANPGASPTDFGFSRLSPDEQKLAVEVYYYLDGFYRYSTMVFDRSGKQLAFIEGGYAPAWLPDGRLLLTGDGFYLTDINLQNPTRIDGGKLNGQLNNPDVHPSGDRIVFEYNQQIWQMNLDGSGLEELIYGSKHLRYPTWSPDGKSLVYLALTKDDYYDRALYFTDLEAQKSYALDLSDKLDPISSSVVPNGPLSWTK